MASRRNQQGRFVNRGGNNTRYDVSRKYESKEDSEDVISKSIDNTTTRKIKKIIFEVLFKEGHLFRATLKEG